VFAARPPLLDLLPATIVLIVPAMAAIAMGGDHIEAQSR